MASAWLNQTIRNSCAKTKVKRFKVLPLETNNQNWHLHKVGETYSISFNLTRDRKNRVPIKVHQSKHVEVLDKILSGQAKQGSLKLVCSKKGVWYACISVSWEVPDATNTGRHLGVDREQNCIAVAVTPEGASKFFHAGQVKTLRRSYQRLRRKLQAKGKHKAVKRLEQKEQRQMRHINHCIAKEIVAFAKHHDCGIILEDLTGIRKNAKQRKKTKSDAAKNRDTWAYYDLESKIQYKALVAQVHVDKVDPRYTSKTCSKCGRLGLRRGHDFYCKRCNRQVHADWNAAKNLSQRYGQRHGMACDLELQEGLAVMAEPVLNRGVNEAPLNSVTQIALFEVFEENENLQL
ncbi:MAG: transposase [Deinococcales bacterium]